MHATLLARKLRFWSQWAKWVKWALPTFTHFYPLAGSDAASWVLVRLRIGRDTKVLQTHTYPMHHLQLHGLACVPRARSSLRTKFCVHFQGHFSTFQNVLVWGVSQRPVYTIRVGTVRYGPHSKENLIRDKLSLVSAGRFGCEATSICFKKDFSW